MPPEKVDPKSNAPKFFGTRHKCEIEEEEDILMPRPPPYSSHYTKCLSCFRSWTVLSRHNPRTRLYFRSQSSIWREKRRHVRNKKYRYIIHPFSKFCLLREIAMGTLWMIVFSLDPFLGAFFSGYIRPELSDIADPARYVQLVLNSFFLLDILSNFFIGYSVDRTKEVILEPGKIRKRYLSLHFIFDFVGTTWNIFIFALKAAEIENVTLISIPQLYCFRFVRMYTMLDYLSRNLQYFRFKESFIRCLSICVFTLYILHWLTCFIFVIPACVYYTIGYLPESTASHNSWILEATKKQHRSTFNLYMECLMTVVCHFFGAGKGSVDARNPTEQFLLSFTIMCGVACHIYAIAVILQLFGTINVSESKYEELIYQLSEYMVTKKLPQPLRKRLYMYYEYRFQKQFFLEEVILSSLSEHLRFEVLLYSCRNLIDKVRIFHGASKAVIGTIISMMKSEIFLPDDVIIKPDTVNENVYFISFGTVCVLLPNGREIVHMEDGHHFGEISILMRNIGERNIGTVVAIEITEVFYLSKTDFMYCMTVHPEIVDRLEKVAIARMNLYYEKLEGSNENIDTMDIITELRKGRILDHGKKRL